MPVVQKDILYPGVWHLPDGRTFDPSEHGGVPYFAKRMRDMMADELPIPGAWEHQDTVKPITKEAWQRRNAEEAKLTFGHSLSATVNASGALVSDYEVEDAEDIKNLRKVKFASPQIEWNYKDPRGKVWPGPSIVHIAATSRPIQVGQKPFRMSAVGTVQPPIRLSLTGYSPMAVKTQKPVKLGGSVGENHSGEAHASSHAAHKASASASDKASHKAAFDAHKAAHESHSDAAKMHSRNGDPHMAKAHQLMAEAHHHMMRSHAPSANVSMSQNGAPMKPVKLGKSDDKDDDDIEDILGDDGKGGIANTIDPEPEKPASPEPEPPAPFPEEAMAPVGPHPMMSEVLGLLAQNGLPLPQDTTQENFIDRLRVSLATKLASENEGMMPGSPEEQAPPVVAMSQAKLARLEELERKEIVGRINALKIPAKLKQKLLDEGKKVSLSAGADGKIANSDLLVKIDAYEQLPATNDFTGDPRIKEVPLSASGLLGKGGDHEENTVLADEMAARATGDWDDTKGARRSTLNGRSK